jgi:hypothetical protein
MLQDGGAWRSMRWSDGGRPQRGVGGIEGVVDGERRIIIAFASETHLI